MKTIEYLSRLSAGIKLAPIKDIDLAVSKIHEVVERGSHIFVCGNGGSALTASHYVTDWGKMRWINKQKSFKVFCLSDNIGMLTAYSNDISYEDAFAQSLLNYSVSGDLLICVSGSGNSENVVRAIDAAKKNNIESIGITGFDGGRLKSSCDISVHYPMNDMQIVEDLHLSFGHIVMKRICDA
ncbi:SIS domain-containing protein [Amylibacter sp.]|nr:SIS domain-containing protein [Amylibacter sp.]MDC1489159.1 SIS domain-containing protein [Amylibacter sp.]